MKNALPLRGRIALWCAALTGAAVAAFAAGTLINLYQEQIEAADMELATEAQHLRRLLPPGVSDAETVRRVQLATAEPWVTFAVFASDGRLFASDEKLAEFVVRAALPAGPPHTVRQGSASWRVQAFAGETETLVVTFDLEEVHEIITDLLIAYLFSLPFAALVAGFGGWWLAGRALAPVRSLTATAAAIGSTNLDQRVPAPAVRDEIGRLSDVLNAMLERLEKSFRQAERFAADASHELRTPLTIMRGELEAVLREPALSPAVEARLLSLQEEAGRLQRVAENLLLLARFDAGAPPPKREPVELSELVVEACEDAEILAAARHVTITTTTQPDLRVRGDAPLLRRLVLNLLDNATKFNVPGGRVTCDLTNSHGRVRLVCGNTGTGIPPEARSRVFERFFRTDAARTETGHGLGLALCREIARSHGGDVVLGPNISDTWTEFVVLLPPGSASKAP